MRPFPICSGGASWLERDRGVGGLSRTRQKQGKIEGKEKVPEACPGCDGSPDNLPRNGLPLFLWVLWNCRPALYSWGLRGDKRPFNSERKEVTEREALREGYQSDIHHTNLSLGTGHAKKGPWRWSKSDMCVRRMLACALVAGVGVTLYVWIGGCRERREGGGLLRCPGCHCGGKSVGK